MINELVFSVSFHLGYFVGAWISSPIPMLIHGLIVYIVFDKIIKFVRKMRKENSNDQI